ncbi:Uncharacterised protein [Raoultella ornithinolytica]|nr:Uncharacterised protein [Raoultella ornithinolytica]
MAVGEQNGHHRFFTAVFEVQLQTFFCRFCAQQRVNNSDPFRALNNGHVGEVKITDLINTVGDFVQTADVDQLRLTPQARIDGGRRFFPFFDEVVFCRVPNNVTLFAFNDVLRQGGNKAFMCIVKVGFISKRQRVIQRVICLLSGCGGLFRHNLRESRNRQRC